MRVAINDLIRKAALITGETPPYMCSREESECATLTERLALEIELQAGKAVASTPREELTGWLPLGDEGITESEDGSALLPLPSDFLLLHSVRLAGWERSVTEMALPDSRTARLQSVKWEGLRGTPERPVGILTVAAGKHGVRLYGNHSHPPTVEEGCICLPHTSTARGISTCRKPQFPSYSI